MTSVNDVPLISVVIRSMGRAELAQALESVARQDYCRIEVILVDATGGQHPPLPDMRWPPGHSLRFLTGDQRLTRPMACNVGLEAVRGEWFCFLDDDDHYEPHHVSTMVDAARQHPDSLLLYSCTNLLDRDGRVTDVIGTPFNRAMMYYGPLFTWPAAFMSRRVRDLGCRFDEAMEICEDRDFMHQVAEHGDFVFVPVASFNYRSELGTSGTGRGNNRNQARSLYFDARLRARWAGPSAYHSARAGSRVRQAIAAHERGDPDEATRLLHALLRDYPDDPNANHALARISLESGQLPEAEAFARSALKYNWSAAEYLYTFACIMELKGDMAEARRAAMMAGSDPTYRPQAAALLARLPVVPARPLAKSRTSRNQPCHCGSGKRTKHCCGAQVTSTSAAQLSPADSAVAAQVEAALAQFDRGDAFACRQVLDAVDVAALHGLPGVEAVADVYWQLADFEREHAFRVRAYQLVDSPDVLRRLAECCDRLWSDLRSDSLRRQGMSLVARINAHSTAAQAGTVADQSIHIISRFELVDGSEAHSLGLYDLLSGDAPVRLWSLGTPDAYIQARYPELRILGQPAESLPSGGTFVVIVNAIDLTPWLDVIARCQRLILVIYDAGVDNYERVINLLTLLDEIQAPVAIGIVLPSMMWRDRVGLGGNHQYPPVDMHRFTRRNALRPNVGGLVVGHQARSTWTEFHPDGPELIRRIVALGHVFRVMGSALLAEKLKPQTIAGKVELWPANTLDARDFLEGLDCFVFCKHPLTIESCGIAIMEAMAMEVPVIVFAKDVGAAELIEHGRSGYLVESVEDALHCLARLADSAELRRSMGQAARRKIMDVLTSQSAELLDYYLGRTAVMG